MSFDPKPVPVRTPKAYRNHEAFMLMTYRCEAGHTERIWNSRDGVTPFTVGCQTCLRAATHIEWEHDQRVPDYVPRPGSRMFVDGTPDIAERLVRVQTELATRHGYTLSRAELHRMIRGARKGQGEFAKGWPFLATV